MKTKHTNGQWYVLPHSKILYIAVQDEIIATINSFRITQCESEANAKLIAAAPELLEACINSLKNFIAIGCTEEAEIVKELVAVIKKATE